MWYKTPGILNMPPNPIVSSFSRIYAGTDNDAGYICYYAGNKWVMCLEANALPSFTIPQFATPFVPAWACANENMYWVSTSGGYIYKNGTVWILSTVYPGYVPKSTDQYWQGSTLPTANGSSVTFNPQGAASGNRVLTGVWNMWSRADATTPPNPAGVYTGSSGNKVFGRERYTDGVTFYEKSLYPDGNGNYTYGNISKHGDVWATSGYGADTGWHEGSAEPNPSTPAIFSFAVPAGVTPPDPLPADITLTFSDYVYSPGSMEVMLVDGAIWR